MSRVLGIDLGTTNSCAAVMDNNTPFVIPLDDGTYTLPSVVAFTEDGRHISGRVAKRQSVLNAENTVFAAKRLIGRPFRDPQAQQAMRSLSYRCVEGPHEDIRVQACGNTYAVQEVSALILGELKQAAERHFGEAIARAVITVPAYFNDLQRQATKDAGQIAGLEVLRIINEPTAAALAYGALERGQGYLAVYDLGGGTFDVSVLKTGGGVIEVLASAGDAFLGGTDFDNRIVDWLTARIEKENAVTLRGDGNAMQRLREAAEAAKIQLSDETSSRLALPFLATTRLGEPLHVEYTLDRDTYERLVVDLVERTVTLFLDTIGKAGIEPRQVDDVILVGGMTRMPKVQQRVAECIGRQPSFRVHPDLVVAVGAAIQGWLLVQQPTDTKLLDVTPHNLGIVALGGVAETVIPKNSSIPTEARRVFTTVSDGQEAVKITVYQGENRRIEHNQILGEFTLQGIRKASRGEVNVEVSFRIDANGIVNVSARDMETGLAQAIQITGSHSLDSGELERMASAHQLLVSAQGAAA